MALHESVPSGNAPTAFLMIPKFHRNLWILWHHLWLVNVSDICKQNNSQMSTGWKWHTLGLVQQNNTVSYTGLLHWSHTVRIKLNWCILVETSRCSSSTHLTALPRKPGLVKLCHCGQLIIVSADSVTLFLILANKNISQQMCVWPSLTFRLKGFGSHDHNIH